MYEHKKVGSTWKVLGLWAKVGEGGTVLEEGKYWEAIHKNMHVPLIKAYVEGLHGEDELKKAVLGPHE